MNFNFGKNGWCAGLYYVLFGLFPAFFGPSHFMDVMINQ